MHHMFRGTGVALVTPFYSHGEVDYPSLEKLVNHVIEGGVNYVVALGTTAETPTLTTAEKNEVLEFIVMKVGGRVPIVCGIGGNNTHEVVEQIKAMNLLRVDGILSVTPYYNKPSQEGLYQHFKAIAQATDKAIILYNVPGRTGINMLPATTLRLANEFEHIVAVKEACGVMQQCMDLVAGKPVHFAVLSGDDDLVLPQIAIGMDGVISVAANCFTKDFTSMVNFALGGDYESARNLHYKLLNGIRLLFVEGNPAGVKSVLAHMNISGNYFRLPVVAATPETDHKIAQFVKNLE
ncbi:MAG: 4-hydroxy-tetrahydrodipicolinate synthase [Sphingobacteriales bacterium]|nr:MAG: 4-hydroxy-tetrahydrodipicolinate synthase [Sphingobacteriales bacterium]